MEVMAGIEIIEIMEIMTLLSAANDILSCNVHSMAVFERLSKFMSGV